VARADLDVAGARRQAGTPIHDAVAPRVDRDEADPARQRLPALLPELGAAVAGEARTGEEAGNPQRAERADRYHLEPDERMDGEGLDMRRAERDDPRNEVRAPPGQHTGQRAAPALADDHRAQAPALHQPPEAILEPLDGTPGAVDVGAQAGLAGVVAAGAQPARHERQRVVAGKEARDQQHRPAAAVGDLLAAVDGAP